MQYLLQLYFRLQYASYLSSSRGMKRISNLSRRLWEAQGIRCESRLVTKFSNNDRFLLPTRIAGCVGTASFSMSHRMLGPSRDASQGDEEVQPGIFRMAASMAQARGTSSDIVLKRVVQEMWRSPITKALWEIRNAEIRFQEKRRAAGQENSSQSLLPVPPSLSRSAVHYPFSSDPYLREEYRNASGLIGRILEDLDALAGNVAFKHCSEDPSFPLLVTASVDRRRNPIIPPFWIVLKRHPRLDSDITLMGRVVWTGRSSMVINMRCVSSAPGECYVGEDPWGRDENCWLDANFTFVARDRETGRSRSVSPLDLGGSQYQGDAKEDDLQKGWEAIWKRVQTHKDRQALERKAAKKDAASLVEVEAARVRREEDAEKLVGAGFPLLHLPALADPHAVLLRQTALSSTMICMPQHRNTADRIFGGFLMNKAYELGFCTAFMFGGSRPTFSEIDEVVFVQAVDVGDLVRLEACVLYTKSGKDSNGNDIPQACVEVLASVVRPQSVESKVSNRFNLTFSFPDIALVGCNRPLLRTVLPADATEASRIVTAKHRESLHETVDEEAPIRKFTPFC